MPYFIRKMQMAIIVLMIITSSTIQGSYYSSTSDCCNPCATECYCQPCCCYEPCGRFFVDAQMLYLRAYEGGLSSVCDDIQIINSTEGGVLVSRLTGRAHDPDFRWNLGFRIGVGYEFANSCSDVGVYWMHYNSCTGSGSRERKWDIDFDVVDVLWGYPCLTYCPMNSMLTLFGGLRWAGIDQKLRTNFVNSIDQSIITSTGRLEEDFFGIGPLFGVQGDIGIGCGFSLYGDIAVGILYGRFHVKSNRTIVSSTGVNIDHLRKHSEAFQPVVDAGVGIRWETYLSNCRLLVLELGFEHHQYFNHNQFCNYGDLSLNGLSLGVGLLY